MSSAISFPSFISEVSHSLSVASIFIAVWPWFCRVSCTRQLTANMQTDEQEVTHSLKSCCAGNVANAHVLEWDVLSEKQHQF